MPSHKNDTSIYSDKTYCSNLLKSIHILVHSECKSPDIVYNYIAFMKFRSTFDDTPKLTIIVY